MIKNKKRLSETAVDDFIKAVKIIAEGSSSGIRITDRDVSMMKRYLTAQHIDARGIRMDISKRRADINSAKFSATWSRR